MPSKRQVLEELKRDQLIAAVERFEFKVAEGSGTTPMEVREDEVSYGTPE